MTRFVFSDPLCAPSSCSTRPQASNSRLWHVATQHLPHLKESTAARSCNVTQKHTFGQIITLLVRCRQVQCFENAFNMPPPPASFNSNWQPGWGQRVEQPQHYCYRRCFNVSADWGFPFWQLTLLLTGCIWENDTENEQAAKRKLTFWGERRTDNDTPIQKYLNVHKCKKTSNVFWFMMLGDSHI